MLFIADVGSRKGPREGAPGVERAMDKHVNWGRGVTNPLSKTSRRGEKDTPFFLTLGLEVSYFQQEGCAVTLITGFVVPEPSFGGGGGSGVGGGV